MITRGNRQQGTPFLIGQDGTSRLERVALDERTFQESWLQELINTNPQILPIDDIESGFAPLISLGREIGTPVGYIDNLFISPDGYLTIVETKLWRNPEAKREVVGQIIDYAKELTTWSFTRLNDSVKSANKGNSSNGIIELINDFEKLDESDEQIIIDNIERNLKRGRFLLLIVGDGIRESVEDMVDYLSNYSQLQFTLGLVELQVYKNPHPGEGHIVIPILLTRTREIIRAIIKIENSTPNTQVEVNADFSDTKTKSTSKRSIISEEDFFRQLEQNSDEATVKLSKKILEDSFGRGFLIEWASSSFAAKYPDPNGSGERITLFIVDKKGMFYLMHSAERLKKLGLPVTIAEDYAKNTAQLISGLGQNPKYPDLWNRNCKTLEIGPIYDDFMSEVEKYIENINKQSLAVNQ